MKISHFLFGFVLLTAAVSIGHSLQATSRVRELERRLQRAEESMQSRSQSLTDNTTSLEKRVHALEVSPPRAQLVGSVTAGLEQRIQNVEQQIKPHLEVLPPYNPVK